MYVRPLLKIYQFSPGIDGLKINNIIQRFSQMRDKNGLLQVKIDCTQRMCMSECFYIKNISIRQHMKLIHTSSIGFICRKKSRGLWVIMRRAIIQVMEAPDSHSAGRIAHSIPWWVCRDNFWHELLQKITLLQVGQGYDVITLKNNRLKIKLHTIF